MTGLCRLKFKHRNIYTWKPNSIYMIGGVSEGLNWVSTPDTPYTKVYVVPYQIQIFCATYFPRSFRSLALERVKSFNLNRQCQCSLLTIRKVNIATWFRSESDLVTFGIRYTIHIVHKARMQGKGLVFGLWGASLFTEELRKKLGNAETLWCIAPLAPSGSPDPKMYIWP